MLLWYLFLNPHYKLPSWNVANFFGVFQRHTERVDQEDGSNRTRVRFNIEGPYGNAFVFAEVSSAMPAGEFVYVLVQDKSNGRVQTLIDNRAALTAARLAGGNKETMAAMSQLLGGGAKRDGPWKGATFT